MMQISVIPVALYIINRYLCVIMNRLIVFVTFLVAIVSRVEAQGVGRVMFNDESADTARITGLLVDAVAALPASATPEQRMSWFADRLTGTPYVSGTLDGDEEVLTVNIDGFDCNTFVETVAALAFTAGENRTSWRDFVYHLQRVRYRKGVVDGYTSRLHYVSDWIVDNAYRGNVREVTGNFADSKTIEKSIDYMTRHRDSYPALADSANYARMRGIESGYRSHRFPYIRSSKVGSKAFKAFVHDGDIIAFTTKTPDLDVQHIGLVRVKDGNVYLMHASSLAGKVEVTTWPLTEYLRRNYNITGVRIVRLVP